MKFLQRESFLCCASVAAYLIGFGAIANASAGEPAASVGEVKIVDCEGMARAAAKVSSGSSVNARAWLKGTSESALPSGLTLILSRAGTSSQESNVGNNGEVAFENLTAGEWKICPNNAAVSVAKVSIEQPAAVGSLAKVVAAGAGIGGLAAVSLAGSSSTSSGSGTAGALVSQSATSTSQAVSSGSGSSMGSSAGSSSSSSSAARPLVAAEDCLNDEEATPVSPFN